MLSADFNTTSSYVNLVNLRHGCNVNASPCVSRAGQVGFSYPTRPEDKVLDSVSIRVEPGETLALVGPSGGGKSTLTKVGYLRYGGALQSIWMTAGSFVVLSNSITTRVGAFVGVDLDLLS